MLEANNSIRMMQAFKFMIVFAIQYCSENDAGLFYAQTKKSVV